jgi:GNAT superfamily N-acetyltransferase
MPRLAQAEDWRAVRALRLRALADAPDAFEMTLAQAEQWTDEDWRRRVAEGNERVTFVEEDEDGNLVGMAVGLLDPAARVAHLVGMFVEPGKRRAGLGRGLVEALESWARQVDAIRIELEVNPDLVPAVRLYERCCFERSGRSRALSSRPAVTVIEMSKTLTCPQAATTQRSARSPGSGDIPEHWPSRDCQP